MKVTMVYGVQISTCTLKKFRITIVFGKVCRFDGEYEGVECDPVAGMVNARKENEGRDRNSDDTRLFYFRRYGCAKQLKCPGLKVV